VQKGVGLPIAVPAPNPPPRLARRVLGDAEHGGKHGEVGDRGGVERTRRAAVGIAHGLDEAIESPMGGGGIVDDGQGIEASR